MPSSPAAKKLRIYEVAKDLGMSSEVIQQIAKKLGVEVKNHMSTLAPDIVAKVRAELALHQRRVRGGGLRLRGLTARPAEDDNERVLAELDARRVLEGDLGG